MIKILIIEDEIPARKKIKRFLETLDAKNQVIGEIDTIEKAIAFLHHTEVDLIFSDIELLDGSAFKIYKQVQVACPIIFTTAYDQFLMNAFESNGIAYLLKPFSKEKFQLAWEKFMRLRNSSSHQNLQLENLTKLIQQKLEKTTYKTQFTIYNHQGIYFLKTEEIGYFEASEGVIFAFDATYKKHLITNNSLKELEVQLNPHCFFKINRSTLINKDYIERIERYNKNTLAIRLKGGKDYLKTSQSATASFREWIER